MVTQRDQPVDVLTEKPLPVVVGVCLVFAFKDILGAGDGGRFLKTFFSQQNVKNMLMLMYFKTRKRLQICRCPGN